MTVTVLFAAEDAVWPEYADVLPKAFAAENLDARIVRLADHVPAEVDYIVYTRAGGLIDFAPYTHLKAVLSLWAGVETVVDNPTLKVPLARMVESGLTEGMVEWCVGHTLRHHLDMDQDILRRDAKWVTHYPPLARNRRVTVLGLGALGRETASALAALGFPVTGWSRSQKSIDGVMCLSGDDGLNAALAVADILILLLPQTEDTTGLIDATRLAMMPQDSVLLNPGRGPLIVDGDLIAALDRGQLKHATLDAFTIEPLPEDDPYWHHPKVTVTPHIASTTRADTAAEVIAENIRRVEDGMSLLHEVDRSAGY